MIYIVFRVILETLIGVISWLFVRKEYIPHINCKNTLVKINKIKNFSPSPWAPGPYSQTIYANIFIRKRHVYTRKETLKTDDSAYVSLDWKESNSMSENTPLVLICPGIAGHHESRMPVHYTDMFYDMGWRSVVYTRRGHGHNSLSSGRLPSYCDMDDMKLVVDHIVSEFPKSPKLILGFSMGGNLVMKYLCQENKDNRHFEAGICICCGFDIAKVIENISKNSVINRLVTGNLYKLLHLKTNDIKELDKILIKQFGFNSIDDYYKSVSCHMCYDDIETPLLIINSDDDPLTSPELSHTDIQYENEKIIVVTSPKGGHLGCLEGWRGTYWYDVLIKEFLNNFPVFFSKIDNQNIFNI